MLNLINYLVCNIDTSLNFNKHVDTVCKSISSKLALLRRIKCYLPIEYRKLFYNAYTCILPSLDYCLTIWGNTSKTQGERLHNLQKCAARIILDAAPDAPSQPLFTELNWLNIYERITKEFACLKYCMDWLLLTYVIYSHFNLQITIDFVQYQMVICVIWDMLRNHSSAVYNILEPLFGIVYL